SGTVRRPCHNRCGMGKRSLEVGETFGRGEWHGQETVPQQVRDGEEVVGGRGDLRSRRVARSGDGATSVWQIFRALIWGENVAEVVISRGSAPGRLPNPPPWPL